MIPHLLNQLKQLRQHYRVKPEPQPRFRPELRRLEDRSLPSTSVLNVWFDGTYGNDSYGPESAIVGVSSFDPATGQESVLGQQAVPGLPLTGFGASPSKPNGVVEVGGKAFFAVSNIGIHGSPASPGFPDFNIPPSPAVPPIDDSSTIEMVDPVTGQISTFATRGRESLGLASDGNGGLLNLWYDGTYGNNYYGAESANVGVSRFDPTTGDETVIYEASVPGLPATSFGTIPKPSGLADVGGRIFFTESTQSGHSNFNNPYGTILDDSSVVAEINPNGPADQTPSPFASKNRESLGLASDGNGGLLNVWFDGVYGSNLYGPDSASIGVSRFDPATGDETVIYQKAIPGLPATTFSPSLPHPSNVALVDGKLYLTESSNPGGLTFGNNPYGGGGSAFDDSSVIDVIDLDTQQSAPFASEGRESLGLAAADLSTTSVSISLSPTQLPTPVLGTPYPQTLVTASGADGTPSFRVSDGDLPDGLLLSDGGLLHGTPTKAGTFEFTVEATLGGLFGAHSYSLTVAKLPTHVQVLAPLVLDGDEGNVTVSVTADYGVPDGSISLTVGDHSFDSKPLVNGSASFDVGVLPIDSYPIQASYSTDSDGNYIGNAGTGSLVVTKHVPLTAPTGGTGSVDVKNEDGSTRFTVIPFDGTFSGKNNVAIGDVNGDGIDDVIIGAGDTGGPRITIYDGSTGKQISNFYAFDSDFRGGVTVAFGVGGEIIAAPGLGGGPEVRVFDAGGSPLANFFAFDSSLRGGVSVVTGDMNGDGIPDIIVGAGAGGGPHVKVFDGSTGDEIASFYAGPANGPDGLPYTDGVTVSYSTVNGPQIVTTTERGTLVFTPEQVGIQTMI